MDYIKIKIMCIARHMDGDDGYTIMWMYLHHLKKYRESNILINNLLALELECVDLSQNIIVSKLVNLDKSISLFKTRLNICK